MAQQQECQDTDWIDEDGCGCDQYTGNPQWCQLYGIYVFEGSSANEACCTCGGGIKTKEKPVFVGEKKCVLSPPLEIAPGLTVENWVDNDNLQFRMRLTYEGRSWIGISFENDGRPGKPPFAVIGRAETENEWTVKKYFLRNNNPDASGVEAMSQGAQTLEDASFKQVDNLSIMEFTKPMNEIFDNPVQVVTDRSTWIYAVGLPNNSWQGTHTIHGKFNLALSPCFTNPWEIAKPAVNGGLVDLNEQGGWRNRVAGIQKPNQFLWVSHGVVLGLAWGIVAPLALATSFWKYKGPKGARLNQICNTTTLLMTVLGILLGVIATYLEEDVSHLRSDHSYWGVGVFGGLLVYCVMALCLATTRAQQEKELQKQRARQQRMIAPPPPLPRIITKKQPQSPDVVLGMGAGMEVLSGDSPHNPRNTTGPYFDPAAFDDYDYVDPAPKPGIVEWISRFFMLAVIGVAYYTCNTGLEWQLLHFNLDWQYYYLGAGIVGVMIVLLLAPLSYCRSDYSNDFATVTPKSKGVSLGAQDSMHGASAQRVSPNSTDDFAFFPKDDDPWYNADNNTITSNKLEHLGKNDADPWYNAGNNAFSTKKHLGKKDNVSWYNPDNNNITSKKQLGKKGNVPWHNTDNNTIISNKQGKKDNAPWHNADNNTIITNKHLGKKDNAPWHDADNNTIITNKLEYFEDGEGDGQRSPMRKSWDVDCCYL